MLYSQYCYQKIIGEFQIIKKKKKNQKTEVEIFKPLTSLLFLLYVGSRGNFRSYVWTKLKSDLGKLILKIIWLLFSIVVGPLERSELLLIFVQFCALPWNCWVNDYIMWNVVFFNLHRAKSVMLLIKLLIYLEKIFSLCGVVQATGLQMSSAHPEGQCCFVTQLLSLPCEDGRWERTLEKCTFWWAPCRWGASSLWTNSCQVVFF